MSSCSIRARDIPGPEPELLGAATIDLSGCHRHEILIGLTEFDKPGGHRIECWPETVLAMVEREFKRFFEQHPERALRAVTTAASAEFCCVVLHHGPKG